MDEPEPPNDQQPIAGDAHRSPPTATEPGGGPGAASLRARRQDRPTGSLTRYERDDVEFSRATAFFDATYALATTLLVTTLDPGTDGWSSWTNLQDSVGQQLVAFVISFAVVAGYWWLNHTFVSSLKGLSPRIIGGAVTGIAFIVLIPFTTEGMALGGEVPTIVYAVNVALVSLSATALYLIAWKEDLYLVRPDRTVFAASIWGSLVTPAVFLASIPVAIVDSPDRARWLWVLLFPLNVLSGRLEQRRVERVAAARGSVAGPDLDRSADG